MVSVRIRALQRKLLRDSWRVRGQVVSIALVVACGVMSVVTMRSNYESLTASLDAYYRDYAFADAFASLVRAPEAVGARLAELPGVAAVETRVVIDVNLDVPGLGEPATGRLLSIAPGGPRINGLHVARGRLPEPGRGNEVVVSAAFAGANGLGLDDELGAVVQGRWERLRIVGIGMSPEFVYELGPGQLFPDNRRFGVLWMDRAPLAAAAGMEGAFNDVVFRFARGASEERTLAEIDRLLHPFGSLGAFSREDQLSNRLIQDELAQTRVSATITPAIFLGVAAFLLHIVLSRMVRTQRDQIAVLKAFGYSDREVGGHFLQVALLAVVIGAVIGTGVGIWLGRLLLGVYEQYFQLPELLYRVSWPLLAGAILVSAAAASVGAISAVRSALALPPAEAMRPEAPARFRPGFLETIGLGALLSPVARMILRNLERQPGRTLLSSLAVALSISILIVGSFMFDAVRFMGDLQFRTIQREDVTVLFAGPRGGGVRHDLRALDGVSRVEIFRTVPARIRAGHRDRQIPLYGLQADGELRRIIDTDFRRHRVPADGVLLTTMLADLVGARPGDTLRVEILEGRQPVRAVPVTGVVDELFGLGAYMEIGALNRLMREGPTASGAYLRIDDDHRAAVYESLKRTPAVAGAAIRGTMLENFEVQLEQSLLISMTMLIFFAGVIAVGVIYNGARIALSERGRELASLRVLGFTRREIAVILFGEQAVVTMLGIPIGFGVGYLMARSMVGAFASETFRIPLIVSGGTYAFAAAVTVLAAVLAGLLVRRRLDRLDLIGVLKTRE